MRFEIVVKGTLSPRLATAFDGITLVPGVATTKLQGVAPDAARLHGVLAHLQELGIDLVSVTTDVTAEETPTREKRS